MSNLNDIIGLLGCLLFVIALPLTFIRQPRFSRRAVIITILIAISIAIAPINNLLVMAYVRGVISDLSITSIILLGYFIASVYSGKEYISVTNKQALATMVLIAAALLYPFALGLGSWDSYAAGYGSIWLYSLLSIVALLLFIMQRLFLTWILLAGILAYLFSLLASQNLWDYLIDPILVIATVFYALKTGIRRSPHQRAHSDQA